MEAPFEIKIDRIQIKTDRDIDIFEIEVAGRDGGVWVETFATEAELDGFIKGLTCASSFFGYILPPPEVPKRSTRRFSDEVEIIRRALESRGTDGMPVSANDILRAIDGGNKSLNKIGF